MTNPPTPVRLTKAQRACLAYVRDQGGSVHLWPAGSGMGKKTRAELEALGFLSTSPIADRALPFMWKGHRITESGIAALTNKDAGR